MPDEYYNSVFTGEEIDARLAGAVRGDVAQTNDNTWKATARANIGAAGTDGETMLQDELRYNNLFNLFATMNRQNLTYNGLTYVWADDGSCHVSGTVSGSSSYVMIYNVNNALPAAIQAGKSYRVIYSGNKVRFRFSYYDTSWHISTTVTADTTITIPATAVGVRFQLITLTNGTVVDETVRPMLLEIKSAAQQALEREEIGAASAADLTAAQTANDGKLLARQAYYWFNDYVFTGATTGGITFAFNASRSACHVTGTSTAAALYTIVNKRYEMPPDLAAGQILSVMVASDSPNVTCRIYWYDSNQQYTMTPSFNHNRAFTVPADTVGFVLRYYVPSGVTVDAWISVPLMTRETFQRAIMSWQKKPRYLVSFVDDDTTNDTLVTRYYQTMMRNGVVGAYAVCPKGYVEGTKNIANLLAYQNDGFTMIPHCYTQDWYLDPRHASFDRARAIESYTLTLKAFRDFGLNYTHGMWIIPYGRSDMAEQLIAQDMGFELAFTTDWDNFILPGVNNPLVLKRNGFSPLSAVTDDTDATEYGTTAIIKRRLQALLDSPEGGWLIVTTHYNAWTEETWDDTVDSTGYPIGYQRFNDLIQFIKASGAEVVSMAQGAAYFKPMIYRNKTNG